MLCHHVIIRHLLAYSPPPPPVMTSFMNGPLAAALTIAQKHQLRNVLNLMQYALHTVLNNHYIKYCTVQSKLH